MKGASDLSEAPFSATVTLSAAEARDLYLNTCGVHVGWKEGPAGVRGPPDFLRLNPTHKADDFPFLGADRLN